MRGVHRVVRRAAGERVAHGHGFSALHSFLVFGGLVIGGLVIGGLVFGGLVVGGLVVAGLVGGAVAGAGRQIVMSSRSPCGSFMEASPSLFTRAHLSASQISSRLIWPVTMTRSFSSAKLRRLAGRAMRP